MVVVFLASSVVGCSKSSSTKKHSKPKVVKNKFLDYRKPKDNLFIQNGGYSKKSKANPFDTKKPTDQTYSQESDTVVYEKQSDSNANKAAASPISYKMEKKDSKNGFLRSMASAIASIFKPKTSNMTQIASKSDIYRPVVNKMVIAGTYSPDHSNLIEQGSYDYDYIDKDTYVEDINIEPIGQIDSTPIIKTPFKSSKANTKKKKKDNTYVKANLISPTQAKSPVDIPQSYDVKSSPEEHNLKNEISSSITGILNVSKMLYGINSEETTPDVEVNIPEIKDEDLKRRGLSEPQLKDIPPVPIETSSKQS